MQTAFDIVTYGSALVVSYYLVLFGVSLWTTRRTPAAADDSLTFVIVVPAHNEELVIGETVRRLRNLRGERYLALVMDDGSTDETASEAGRAAAGDPRITVVKRSPAISGRGKGGVLNHAYRLVSDMARDGDDRLNGAGADRVVICVLDADGWLEPNALEAVAPYYADPQVAGVQLPVRMWNGRDGFLALMQDMEFVGFCLFVQAGRDPFGSVGLGGNGQFIRLSALESLGASPWTRCLTEDLDVGLSLVEHGWRNRFCPRSPVSQQAVRGFRPFFRQRTRWIQGHYSCWQHLPAIWSARGVPMLTRFDLSLYLMLVALVLVLAAQFTLGMVSILGLLAVETSVLSFIHDPHLYRVATVALSGVPLLAFGITYQRYAAQPLPLWSLPGLFFLFAFYGFFWGVPASLRALGRLALRRESWTKTPRTPVDAPTPAAEPAAPTVARAKAAWAPTTVAATVGPGTAGPEGPRPSGANGANANGRRSNLAQVVDRRLREVLRTATQAEERVREAEERVREAQKRLAEAPAPAGGR